MTDNDEDRSDRLDRELIELLNELRVALPGVQVLFGFLLVVPFSNGWERITETQKTVFFGTFVAAAVATALLIAPTAQHRVQWRMRDKETLLRRANALAIGGTTCLALAMAGAVWVVTDVLYGRTLTAFVTAAIAALYALIWFVIPLWRRATRA